VGAVFDLRPSAMCSTTRGGGLVGVLAQQGRSYLAPPFMSLNGNFLTISLSGNTQLQGDAAVCRRAWISIRIYRDNALLPIISPLLRGALTEQVLVASAWSGCLSCLGCVEQTAASRQRSLGWMGPEARIFHGDVLNRAVPIGRHYGLLVIAFCVSARHGEYFLRAVPSLCPLALPRLVGSQLSGPSWQAICFRRWVGALFCICISNCLISWRTVVFVVSGLSAILR